MKISRGEGFVPILITVETLREARVLLSALIIGDNAMIHFNGPDKITTYDFIRALKSEGITEI